MGCGGGRQQAVRSAEAGAGRGVGTKVQRQQSQQRCTKQASFSCSDPHAMPAHLPVLHRLLLPELHGEELRARLKADQHITEVQMQLLVQELLAMVSAHSASSIVAATSWQLQHQLGPTCMAVA